MKIQRIKVKLCVGWLPFLPCIPKTQYGGKNGFFDAKNPIHSFLRGIFGIFSFGKYVGCKVSCVDLGRRSGKMAIM